MLVGFSGTLVSGYFVEEFLADIFAAEIDRGGAASARRLLQAARRRTASLLGPVCGARQVHDLVTAPLADALGYRLAALRRDPVSGSLVATARPAPVLFVTTAWGERLDRLAREIVRSAVEASTSWCLCVNGEAIRAVEAGRPYARRFLQFELDAALANEEVFAALWILLRAASLVSGPGHPSPGSGSLLQRAIEASDRNTVAVCRSLQQGMLHGVSALLRAALRGNRTGGEVTRPHLHDVHRQVLTIAYRILFLLFAESRRLVPCWQATYRDAYSLGALIDIAERPGPATGAWETIQAMSRLSHAGCRAGDLQVTPFNGRLFSPSDTPLAEQGRLDDESVREVILALATTPRRGGRARIVYRDLDVEQLGAVYESLLDYAPVVHLDPARVPDVTLAPGSGLRKATASFYTPRALTTYVVRRTLTPLVAEAAPEDILALRIVDPAMGSGAFLVAACRFLAAEYAAALVRSGRCLPADIGEADLLSFRRTIAQRCLYGVDLNPMAVQLARLSLWLATLAPDHPLSFLDHRLVVGDSLVGASPDDVLRGPGPRSGRRSQPVAELPSLFGDDALGPVLRAVLPARAAMEERPDDAIGDVREKERLMDAVTAPGSPAAAWRTVLTLWCGQHFPGSAPRVTPGIFAALTDHLLAGRSSLGAAAAQCLTGMAGLRDRLRPLHWPLEFPEAFYGADGAPLARPGFDAVVGNPPWDMIRADNVRDGSSRDDISGLLRFSRDSGVYRWQGRGHANRFQLFVERAFQLLRREGRVGLVVPWGLFADEGCARLRRLLFERAALDAVIGFDNAERVFPIHRGVRFAIFTATSGGSTTLLRARLGARDPAVLDESPSEGGERDRFPVVLSRGLLERLSGESLSVPDVRCRQEVALLEQLLGAAPSLSGAGGWRVAFGRELNATEDKAHFTSRAGGLPVLEGKHVAPFRAFPAKALRYISRDAAAALLGPRRGCERPRLCYRDVSSASNRLTLIAAIVPAGCVTVHTLYCLKPALPLVAQHFLCGVLNSLVANYFVRFWVSSHVTTALVGRLPVPFPDGASRGFRRVARLAALLSRASEAEAHPAYAWLQAEVAVLYRLGRPELDRIVESFPLIAGDTKARIRDEFDRLSARRGIGP